MLNASRWAWEPATDLNDEFWVGVDDQAARWLIKMRGGFYALREVALGRLASRLDLTCQESDLVELPAGSPPLMARPSADPCQAAVRLLTRHQNDRCGVACPLPERLPLSFESVSDPALALASSSVVGAKSWIVADFLAEIFGANEGSEQFFTADHVCTLVDNEQFFSTPSSWRGESKWLFAANGQPSPAGETILLETCEVVANLSTSDIAEIVAVPDGFRINPLWPLEPILDRGVQISRELVGAGRPFLRQINGTGGTIGH